MTRLPALWFIVSVLSRMALALGGGDPNREPTAVTLFRDDRPVGMGVWISPHHILTVSSLCPAHLASELGIHGGDRWEKTPSLLQTVHSAVEFGPLLHPRDNAPLESPMILLTPSQAPAVAGLPGAGESPGERTGNRSALPIVGLGWGTGAVWKAAASVEFGKWMTGTVPPGPFLFSVESPDHPLAAWDRGAPLYEDRTVMGVLGQQEGDAIGYFWVGHPEVLSWVQTTLEELRLPVGEKSSPKLGTGEPTGLPLSEPPVPDAGDPPVNRLP